MKKYFELVAPCHFGMEAVLKKEIIDLGYEISLVEDGRVTFLGDDEAICRANVFLRTAERPGTSYLHSQSCLLLMLPQ